MSKGVSLREKILTDYMEGQLRALLEDLTAEMLRDRPDKPEEIQLYALRWLERRLEAQDQSARDAVLALKAERDALKARRSGLLQQLERAGVALDAEDAAKSDAGSEVWTGG
eukprot:TRINITY_DN42164_c0_g1_i1.p1 TRINITY_DN42164_c0_g1~~TRINITY_DN42164_c0_g1_i1.p1  ORF type:complete len:112 (+),score=23.29 TRINITY_DN42164_c0_g1_i1:184-519(+)